MYTTPLSTLISSISLDHHLYANDTQLFFSFNPLNFESNISHLQDALQHISSGMTANSANLLTLNSSEFLLIELKNQLAKIHNSSLDTSHSARNLGFIFDEHLTFSDQITALSKACYYHIRQLRYIRPYLDSSTACTVAASIVHSKLDYCNSLYYKLAKSSRSRTLLLVLLLKLPSFVTSLPYALFTGSGSLNASYTSSSHLYLQSSHNYPTPEPSQPHLRSTSSQYSLLLLSHLHQSVAPSVMLHLVSGICSLCLFVNLILEREFTFAKKVY